MNAGNGSTAIPAGESRGLVSWWKDDPANPGRARPTHAAVQALVGAIAPGAEVSDLGGTMSLNLHLRSAGLVLRVHQPFVSRCRLEALQQVRRGLRQAGLQVPEPVAHEGHTTFRLRDRWAELENFLPHVQPEPSLASYKWLFDAMGRLHAALSKLPVSVPRPLVATYAPPGSLGRWLRRTEAAAQHDPAARETVRRAHDLVSRLRRHWISAPRLPQGLVHGDLRLGNVALGPHGETVYLDFGFMALRPRVHDLAYALAFMVIALQGDRAPACSPWDSVPALIDAYERAGGTQLTPEEREALPGYTAAVPLYFTALAGYTDDPLRQLRAHGPWLAVSEWILSQRDMRF